MRATPLTVPNPPHLAAFFVHPLPRTWAAVEPWLFLVPPPPPPASPGTLSRASTPEAI
jgi:hypothetical protein